MEVNQMINKLKSMFSSKSDTESVITCTKTTYLNREREMNEMVQKIISSFRADRVERSNLIKHSLNFADIMAVYLPSIKCNFKVIGYNDFSPRNHNHKCIVRIKDTIDNTNYQIDISDYQFMDLVYLLLLLLSSTKVVVNFIEFNDQYVKEQILGTESKSWLTLDYRNEPQITNDTTTLLEKECWSTKLRPLLISCPEVVPELVLRNAIKKRSETSTGWGDLTIAY